MKFIHSLFHQPVLLTTLGLLTISSPTLADPLMSEDYVLLTAVFSNSGGEANSTEYSLTATVGTPFAEMDTVDETAPVGDRTAAGTLRDEQGNPIPNATIEIDGKTTTTDALGNWQINGLMDETTYTVTASKDGYTFAPTTVEIGNQNVTTQVTITPLTTLKLTAKPDTWKTIGQSEELTYTFTLINGGQQTATGITLTEQLPAGTTLVSLSTPDGTCDPATTRCTLSDLTPGTTTTVTLTLKVDKAGTLKNVATLTSNEYPVDVQTSWKEVKPYLSVTLTDSPDPVLMQGKLHYQAQVELSALADKPTAEQVKLTLELPQGTSLDAVTTDDGTCDSSKYPRITCDLHDLSIATPDSQSVATVTLDVKLEDAGLLVLTQDATVTATEYPAHTVKTRTRIFVPKDLKVDAILVLDTTNSMQGELNGVKIALEKFIAQLDSSLSPTIALIGFKDDVKVLAFTQDLPLLKKVVAGLKAEGGGLCPEASVEALNVALDHVKDDGMIFFSTDASPYEDADLEALLTRLQMQAVKLNAVVSGDCTDGKESWNEVK